MGKNPAVLFYTSDFLSGTMLFSNEEKGIYITLLCLQHQIFPEHIPENHMISVCLSNDSQVIKKFKIDENGKYYNERMQLEIESRLRYCSSRSNNKSGRKSKESYDNSVIIHMENENENTLIKSSLSLSEREKIFKEAVFAEAQYPQDMLTTFFNYWSEANEGGKKMRYEMQKTWDLRKRLATWRTKDREKNYGNRPKLDFENRAAGKYDNLSITQIGSSM